MRQARCTRTVSGWTYVVAVLSRREEWCIDVCMPGPMRERAHGQWERVAYCSLSCAASGSGTIRSPCTSNTFTGAALLRSVITVARKAIVVWPTSIHNIEEFLKGVSVKTKRSYMQNFFNPRLSPHLFQDSRIG